MARGNAGSAVKRQVAVAARWAGRVVRARGSVRVSGGTLPVVTRIRINPRQPCTNRFNCPERVHHHGGGGGGGVVGVGRARSAVLASARPPPRAQRQTGGVMVIGRRAVVRVRLKVNSTETGRWCNVGTVGPTSARCRHATRQRRPACVRRSTAHPRRTAPGTPHSGSGALGESPSRPFADAPLQRDASARRAAGAV